MQLSYKVFPFIEKLLAYRANDSGYDKITTYDIRYRQFRKSG